jgi:hypothetical protein
VLDLTGVTHSYRFQLSGEPPVTGKRGACSTIDPQTAVVRLDGKGVAVSVTVTGRLDGGLHRGRHGHAIFYRMDLEQAGPDALARRLADAAEREWALLLHSDLTIGEPGKPEPV